MFEIDPQTRARVAEEAIAGGLSAEEQADLAARLRWLRRCAEKLRALPVHEEPALALRSETPRP